MAKSWEKNGKKFDDLLGNPPSGVWGDYAKMPGFTSAKAELLNAAKSFFRGFAKDVLKTKGDIRVNPAGPAVAGEVTLITEDWYFNTLEYPIGDNTVLWRERSESDPYGVHSRNRFARLSDLPRIMKKNYRQYAEWMNR